MILFFFFKVLFSRSNCHGHSKCSLWSVYCLSMVIILCCLVVSSIACLSAFCESVSPMIWKPFLLFSLLFSLSDVYVCTHTYTCLQYMYRIQIKIYYCNSWLLTQLGFKWSLSIKPSCKTVMEIYHPRHNDCSSPLPQWWWRGHTI